MNFSNFTRKLLSLIHLWCSGKVSTLTPDPEAHSSKRKIRVSYDDDEELNHRIRLAASLKVDDENMNLEIVLLENVKLSSLQGFIEKNSFGNEKHLGLLLYIFRRK